MRTADGTLGALLVGAIAVICCAGPLLVAAIGTAALAAWFSKPLYVLIPVVIIAAGIGAVWLQRVHARRQPEKKALKHE